MVVDLGAPLVRSLCFQQDTRLEIHVKPVKETKIKRQNLPSFVKHFCHIRTCKPNRDDVYKTLRGMTVTWESHASSKTAFMARVGSVYKVVIYTFPKAKQQLHMYPLSDTPITAVLLKFTTFK